VIEDTAIKVFSNIFVAVFFVHYKKWGSWGTPSSSTIFLCSNCLSLKSPFGCAWH